MGRIINKDLLKRIQIFFLDCISFNTPEAIVFNISVILLILVVLPTEYLVYSPAKCVFKNIIFPIIFRGNCPNNGILAGCECPACGLTRGMSRLLKGDIDSAIDYNLLTIPLLFLMISVMIFNIYKIHKKK